MVHAVGEEMQNKIRKGGGGHQGHLWGGDRLSLKVIKVSFIEEVVFGLSWLEGDQQGVR